jgi:multidrug efflux pump subunit AcrA (membrane-fusion protein)
MKLLMKVAALVVVVLAGAWAYYANVSSGKPAMDMNMRVTSGNTPFPVTLTLVERGSVTGNVVYTGSVASLNEEDIYPRVTGRIVEMRVYPGDRVEKGQVVARLDDLELTSRVREAEAVVVAAQANRVQMEADLAAVRQGVVQMEKELAAAEAEAGYQQAVAERDERLFSKGALSQQEAENTRAMATAARARVQAARARVEQAEAMVASARKKLEAADAMVAQGQAAVRTTEIVRGYVDIVAQSNGYVVKRLVAPGVLVQPGMAILKTTQVDKVRLQANVGEKDLASIKVGSPVTVTTSSGAQPPLGARVTSVFPFVDPGARTAVVEAVVDNAGRRFLPGQYVQMQFTTGERKDALTVPRAAVARMGGKATVWVLKGEDQVEPVEVATGLENPERVEILKGLAGGERVVAQGHEGLYAGARVSDVSAAKPASQAGTDPRKGMPGMGEAPAKAQQPEKASDTKAMPGHGAETKVAQAGGGAPPAEKLSITLVSNPVKLSSGNAKLRIEVKDPSGAPVSDAKVEVNAVMSGMTVPKVTARAAKESGVYDATVKLGMAGTWTVEVTATRPQGGPTSAKLNFEAK